MKLIGGLALAVVFAGCAPTVTDTRLCLAGRELVTSINLTIQAQAADTAGEADESKVLASEAADQVKLARANLDSVIAESVRESIAWQSLLDADLHAGQAANALLPEYANTYGMTSSEIDSAIRSLKQAGDIGGCVLPSLDAE